MESVLLVESDGPSVLLQSPQSMCAHMLHRIVQQLGTDPMSLQHRLYEELLHFGILDENEALHNTVIIDPDVFQGIGIPPGDRRHLQLPKLEFITAKNGIKLQSVIENLDLCDPVEIVSPCFSDHR